MGMTPGVFKTFARTPLPLPPLTAFPRPLPVTALDPSIATSATFETLPRICKRHFRKTDYLFGESRNLKKGTIPSLELPKTNTLIEEHNYCFNGHMEMKGTCIPTERKNVEIISIERFPPGHFILNDEKLGKESQAGKIEDTPEPDAPNKTGTHFTSSSQNDIHSINVVSENVEQIRKKMEIEDKSDETAKTITITRESYISMKRKLRYARTQARVTKNNRDPIFLWGAYIAGQRIPKTDSKRVMPDYPLNSTQVDEYHLLESDQEELRIEPIEVDNNPNEEVLRLSVSEQDICDISNIAAGLAIRNTATQSTNKRTCEKTKENHDDMMSSDTCNQSEKFLVRIVPDIEEVHLFSESHGKLLHSSVMKELGKVKDPNIKFDFCDFERGRYKFVCPNESAKEWALKIVPTLTGLWKDPKIKTIDCGLVPKMNRASHVHCIQYKIIRFTKFIDEYGKSGLVNEHVRVYQAIIE
ncbi:hypothetical protein Bhyg_07821 [Pseudolycoriella hygida]|uniref:DUF4780 domain-containing protein n=1 Tax=Pseudolycoriella hygida TaxID=35572 RepID=A0A9Q0S473_9DIPT|nr:hypothetical protein Bhyg_07821 [Pseudolycoriella hygida]